MSTTFVFDPQRNATNDVFDQQLLITNGLLVSEPRDTFAASGTSGISGTFAATEDPDGAIVMGGSDMFDAVGTVTWASSMSVTEPSDTFAATAPNTVQTMAATEARDTFAALGSGSVRGTWASQERQDTARFMPLVTSIGSSGGGHLGTGNGGANRRGGGSSKQTFGRAAKMVSFGQPSLPRYTADESPRISVTPNRTAAAPAKTAPARAAAMRSSGDDEGIIFQLLE